MSWEDILQDPEFQRESPDVQQKVAEEYFRRHILQDPEFQREPPEIQELVRKRFFATLAPLRASSAAPERLAAEPPVLRAAPPASRMPTQPVPAEFFKQYRDPNEATIPIGSLLSDEQAADIPKALTGAAKSVGPSIGQAIAGGLRMLAEIAPDFLFDPAIDKNIAFYEAHPEIQGRDNILRKLYQRKEARDAIVELIRPATELFADAEATHAAVLEGERPELKTELGQTLYGGAVSAGTALSAVPFALASPKAPLAILSALTTGGAYGESRREGVPEGRAMASSLGQGAVEWLTEKTPLSLLMKRGTPFVKRLLGTLIAEEFGEATATTLQLALDMLARNPDMTWGEYKEQLLPALRATALQTPVAVGIQTGVVHPFVRRPKTPSPPPAPEAEPPQGEEPQKPVEKAADGGATQKRAAAKNRAQKEQAPPPSAAPLDEAEEIEALAKRNQQEYAERMRAQRALPAPETTETPEETVRRKMAEAIAGNELTPEQARIIQEGGGIPHAMQRYDEFGREPAAIFHDPETKSSHQLPLSRLTAQNVAEVLKESRKRFRAAEKPTTETTAPQQAIADAARLSERHLELMRQDDEEGLLSQTNQDFVRASLQDIVGSAELGKYVTPEGGISQEGAARVRNAVFAKAYGTPDVFVRMAESPDGDIRSMANAMLAAAPTYAKLKSAIASGDRYDLDISADIAAAARKLMQLRDEGESVQNYLRQGALFAEDIPPLTHDVLAVFDQYKRSTKKLREILTAYADHVDALGNPKQRSLFDNIGQPTRAEILQATILQVEGGENVQATLFKGQDEPGAAPTQVGEAQAGYGADFRQYAREFIEQHNPEVTRSPEALAAAERALLHYMEQAQARVSTVSHAIPAGSKTRGPRVLGIGITTELVQKGFVDFRGRTVKTARDLAVIAQVLRDPQMETWRVFYIKENTIIGQEAWTSGLPDAVIIRKHDKDDSRIVGIRRSALKLGADQVYFLHNHPSGDPRPSPADERSTGALAARLPEFRGHIVINSGKYSVIDKEGKWEIHELAQEQERFLVPSLPHPLLGNTVQNERLLAENAARLKTAPDYLSVFYLHAGMKIRAIEELPAEMLSNLIGITKYLNKRAKDYGASSVVMAGRVPHHKFHPLIKAAVITDAISWHEDQPVSARKHVISGLDTSAALYGHKRENYFIGEKIEGAWRLFDHHASWEDANQKLLEGLKELDAEAVPTLKDPPIPRAEGEPTVVMPEKPRANLGALRALLGSPSKIGKIARFYVTQGKKAIHQQDRMRYLADQKLKKIFSGLSKEENQQLLALSLMGDAINETFTPEELNTIVVPRQQGGEEIYEPLSERVKNAYLESRRFHKQVWRLLSAHRRIYGQGVGYIEGHVPHIYDNYLLYEQHKVVEDGKEKLKRRVIGSYPSIHEAAKAAKKLSPNFTYVIQPKAFKMPDELLRRTVLKDGSYFALRGRLESFGFSPEEAAEMVEGIARRKGRHRLFGHLMKRTGQKGFRTDDLQEILRHYYYSAARYLALDSFKASVIPQFERDFGVEFGRASQAADDVRALATYIEHYISDVNGVPGLIESWLDNSIKWAYGKLGMADRIASRRPTIWTVNALMHFTAVTKLGMFNLSAGIVNLTQMINSFAKNPQHLLWALSHVYSRDAQLNAILHRIGVRYDVGLTDTGGYSWTHRGEKLVRASMFFFREAEKINRIAVALAGYRRAIEEFKWSQKKAIRYARQLVDETQFDYSVADTAHIFRNPAGRLIGQFRPFAIKQIEFITGLRGAEHVRFWVPILLMAGIMGIPLVEGFSRFVRWLTGDDPVLETKKMLIRWAGDDPQRQAIAEIAIYGLLSQAGIDISRRVGTGDVLPRTFTDILGPTINTLIKSYEDVGRRAMVTAVVKNVAPSIGNIIDALTAVYNDMRVENPREPGRLKYIATYSDIAAKIASLRPIAEAKRSDILTIAAYERDKERAFKQRYMRRVLESALDGDGEGVVSALEEMMELGEKEFGRPMVITDSDIAAAVLNKNLPEEWRTFLRETSTRKLGAAADIEFIQERGND